MNHNSLRKTSLLISLALLLCLWPLQTPVSYTHLRGLIQPPCPRSRGRLPLHPHSAMMIGGVCAKRFLVKLEVMLGYGHRCV